MHRLNAYHVSRIDRSLLIHALDDAQYAAACRHGNAAITRVEASLVIREDGETYWTDVLKGHDTAEGRDLLSAYCRDRLRLTPPRRPGARKGMRCR